MAKKLKILDVLGRRWFARSYGNTYHTAEVAIDGKHVLKTDRSYGYGDQYVQSAIDALVKRGIGTPQIRHSSGGLEGFRQWAERNGFVLKYTAVDVGRQKDL
jgi:hypothetical protein